MLEKGSLKVQEFKVVANDGTKKDVEMSLAIMKDADGKPIVLVAISRNVYEHKKRSKNSILACRPIGNIERLQNYFVFTLIASIGQLDLQSKHAEQLLGFVTIGCSSNHPKTPKTQASTHFLQPVHRQ